MNSKHFQELLAASPSSGFAIWKAPSDEGVHLLIDLGKGGDSFTIAPFQKEDEIISLRGEAISLGQLDLDISSSISSSIFNGDSTSREDHCAGVEQAIKTIGNSNLDKVVVSTQTFVEGEFDPFQVFLKLLKAHPTTFVHLSFHPASGTWIGASPEPLIVQENDAFRTVSLAGTRAVSQQIEAWGQKESLEQSIVTDYIKGQLEKAGAENIRIERPETLRFGDIEHLKSDIRFNTSNPAHVVSYLHPTPAVGGTPLKEALDLIDQVEGHKRSYYTGYIGCSGVNLTTTYFVNLRCLQFHHNGLLFFTGGGITLDSEPDSEWMETREKLNSLMHHIEKI